MTEIDLTKLLSKKEKAIELGVSTKTVERYVKKNKLSVVRIKSSKRKWFFPKNDITQS